MVTKVFDKTNKYWENSTEYNMTFLTCQEKYHQELLTINGFVNFLDLLVRLGFKPTTDEIQKYKRMYWCAGDDLRFNIEWNGEGITLNFNVEEK